MNVGCLIDIEAYAFHYTKFNRYKPVLGCGTVLNGVPYFVTMHLNHRHNDPDSVFQGQRLKNGWKNAGAPWTYKLTPERMLLPKQQN